MRAWRRWRTRGSLLCGAYENQVDADAVEPMDCWVRFRLDADVAAGGGGQSDQYPVEHARAPGHVLPQSPADLGREVEADFEWRREAHDLPGWRPGRRRGRGRLDAN